MTSVYSQNQQTTVDKRNRLATSAVHVAALFCLVAAVYPQDSLRVPGLESSPIGFVLYLIRGVVVVHQLYLVWPITAIGLILTMRQPMGAFWRCRVILPLLIWVAYYICRCLSSDIGPVGAKFRWEGLLIYQLPVLLPLFLIRMPGGAMSVRNWFFWAGTFQLLSTVVIRKILGFGFSELALAQENETDRLVIVSNTITTSLLLLQTALCGINIFMDSKASRPSKLAAIVIVPLTILLALATGSRGPIVAFIGALLLLLVLTFKRAIRFAPLVVGVGLVIAGAVALLPVISEKAGERFDSSIVDMLSGDTQEESTVVRLQNYEYILTSQPTAFGYGVSSFGHHIGDSADYAHNIFLEALYETGVIGFLGFTFMIVYYVAQGIKRSLKRRNPEVLFCTTCFAFYLIENLFSGSFAGSAMWAAFLMLGAWTCAADPRPEKGSVKLEQRGSMRPILSNSPD